MIAELESQGCNMQEALARFMGKKALLEKMMVKLPASIEPLEVLSFIDSGNIEQATANAHTIKGVTGNLSVTPLYTAYTEIVNLLRAGKSAEAKELLLKTLPVQEKLLEIIKSAQ